MKLGRWESGSRGCGSRCRSQPTLNKLMIVVETKIKPILKEKLENLIEEIKIMAELNMSFETQFFQGNLDNTIDNWLSKRTTLTDDLKIL